MNSVFLDSNVVANWILIKDSTNKFEELKKDEILKERLSNISYSHILVEALLGTDEYYSKVSNLALAEVFYVLYTEISSLRMYRLGIPMTLWPKLRKKYASEEDLYLIKEIVSKYIKELKNKIGIVNDEIDEEVYPKLVLDYRLRTHDAVLLTTSILNKCSWYITNDKEIVDLDKGRRKPKFSERFKISPELPQNFLREL
ncbi:MAG: hypothetical protein BME93_05125 [Methanosarcinales archaeon Met12]|nr:MAG: hypothetical protein BME93_05125 [Methanosarcinales archaeon Met12]